MRLPINVHRSLMTNSPVCAPCADEVYACWERLEFVRSKCLHSRGRRNWRSTLKVFKCIQMHSKAFKSVQMAWLIAVCCVNFNQRTAWVTRTLLETRRLRMTAQQTECSMNRMFSKRNVQWIGCSLNGAHRPIYQSLQQAYYCEDAEGKQLVILSDESAGDDSSLAD